jgi:NAD(P)-dependent dehydrogenase (short-subunit alcohol dehydrogenase family)
MKNILITGVSSGIGRDATEFLLKKGYNVFGSVRKLEDAEELTQKYSKNFTSLIFDVTDEKAVIESVKIVENKLMGQYLDCLINNAGIAVGGPSILLETKHFRHQLEVNLFGVISVTNAYIKLLGADLNNQHSGKIINISSVSGKRAFPFVAPYTASKFALEGYSDALRRELILYGIDVILIEPGPIKTAIWDKIPNKNDNPFLKSDYKNSLGKFYKLTVKNGKNGLEPIVISERIYKIINLAHPKTRYMITINKFINHYLPSIIPDRWFDKLIRNSLGLIKKN